MSIFYNTTEDIYLSSQVVGYIAGILVISYNIPQLVRMIRTKSTDDVELMSLIFQMILNIVYVTYGTLLQEIPLIISESIAFIICISMVVLKKIYDKKTRIHTSGLELSNSQEVVEDIKDYITGNITGNIKYVIDNKNDNQVDNQIENEIDNQIENEIENEHDV